MIIVTERKLSYKSDLRDPKEVQAFFDMIWKAFSDIGFELGKLTTIFIDSRWSLKEGLSDSLVAYAKAAEEIRKQLTMITMMNTTLTKFLAGEVRPIPLIPNTSNAIDELTKTIKSRLKFYYKEVSKSKSPFPNFDTEIKQHQDIVEVINANIDRINEINSAYPRHRAIRHIKSLSEIR